MGFFWGGNGREGRWLTGLGDGQGGVVEEVDAGCGEGEGARAGGARVGGGEGWEGRGGGEEEEDVGESGELHFGGGVVVWRLELRDVR